MLYVHVAEAHAREWPETVQEAARREMDPDKRIIAMLAARSLRRGSHVAAARSGATDSAEMSAA